MAIPIGVLSACAVISYHWRLWIRDKSVIVTKQPVPDIPDFINWATQPSVGVLVAAWNEAEKIDAHITSFLSLRYPSKKLFLCAGGEDGTFKLAARWARPEITVLEQRVGEGKQAALNRCFQACTTPVIFLTDADCLLEDDSFERTIFPVATGQERVCTGGSRPNAELQDRSFVVAQAGPQLYHSVYMPAYTSGLLGRNCALERSVVEQVAGFEQLAPTGTDYVLAKTLLKSNIRIRHLPESRIPTEYPVTMKHYVRQQRRWLRNVVVHGLRYKSINEVCSAFLTSIVGLGMLTLPLFSLIFGIAPIIGWVVLLLWRFLSRLRYLFFSRKLLGRPITIRHVLMQIPMLFLDFVAWCSPLADYVAKKRRRVW